MGRGVRVWWNFWYFFLVGGRGWGHRKTVWVFFELFLNILWFFLRSRYRIGIFLGVAYFQLFLGVCLILLIFFWGRGGGNSWCLVEVYLARKFESTPPHGDVRWLKDLHLLLLSLNADSHRIDHGFVFLLWIYFNLKLPLMWS